MKEVAFKALIKQGIITPFPGVAGRVAVELSMLPKDTPLDVKVSVPTRKRTLPQLRRYWKLIVPAFAEWTGYTAYPEHLEERDLAALKDSAHRTLKALFIGTRTVKRTLPNGRVIEEIQEPSTKDLTTAEFARLQDLAEKLLNENGIYLQTDESLC